MKNIAQNQPGKKTTVFFFYNNLGRLLSLLTYNSANKILAAENLSSFGELLRNFAFSFMFKILAPVNLTMVNIYNSLVPLFSKIWAWWYEEFDIRYDMI